jgi:VanZ family protein
VGLTTEFIQKYLVPGRNFDLLDWAADSLGAFTTFSNLQEKIYLANKLPNPVGIMPKLAAC